MSDLKAYLLSLIIIIVIVIIGMFFIDNEVEASDVNELSPVILLGSTPVDTTVTRIERKQLFNAGIEVYEFTSDSGENCVLAMNRIHGGVGLSCN